VDEPRWEVCPPAGPEALARLGVGSPLLAQLLWNRGIRDAAAAERFLHPERAALHDPWQMAGVAEAVRCIRAAVAAGAPIAIHGDYDADGVTATAVLVEALRQLGARPLFHIPHRAREGYGLSAATVRRLAAQGVRLLLTVDCGITANAEVALAAELGMEVVVTDHHHVPVDLPAARAVLNPRQPGCRYPFRELAGVGVAYVLARALLESALPAVAAERAMEALLDLVALGTIADMVPLVGENRVLVARGLRVLREARRPGLQALMAVAGVAAGDLTAPRVAYSLVPRLNAAGRMADAVEACRLLLAADRARAEPLAERLEALNRVRQQAVAEAVAQARALADPRAPAAVVVGDFPVGIVGLVAGRLAQETGRPWVVLARGAEYCRGSARGPEGFHLAAALERCADVLVQHGGHAQAAGLTLRARELPAFVERFQALAAAVLGTAAAAPRPRWRIDGVVPLGAIDWAFAETLLRLEPCGVGNPSPLFLTHGAQVRESRTLQNGGGANGDGAPCSPRPAALVLRLSDGGVPLRGVAFECPQVPAAGETVDVVYEVERRTWGEEVRIELRIRDLRPAGTSHPL
jgi:single-stranded-DNA-specific exonuclease